VVASWFEGVLECEAIVDDAMAEMSLGDFEGRPFAELESDVAFSRFMENWKTAKAPGGESVPEFESRIRSLLRARMSANEGGVEVWIAHAGVIRALRVIAQKRSWDAAMKHNVPHLEPIEFALDAQLIEV
jgi:alpha-ribazole phosphatase